MQYISGGPKKVSQLLVGHNFKTASKNSTKLHATFFQPIGFPKQMDNSVEMTVALKLGVQKSNIVDTSNIGCVWHELCMVYC